MTESNPTDSVYYASPVEGKTNFTFTKGPNVGIPQVVAAKDTSKENTRMLIAAQAVYFPEKKTTKITSAVLHYRGKEAQFPWTIVGEISRSFPLKFDTSYSVGTLQLCATEDFTFLYFFSPWVEGKLYFIKNEGLLENEERCWFPAELPAHFQFKASLESKGHLISGSYKPTPNSAFQRSYIDLNNATERIANPECCAPYTIKRKNVDEKGTPLSVSQTEMSAITDLKNKPTIKVEVQYQTLRYEIESKGGIPSVNGAVNPGQHYSIDMRSDCILQGTHLKTGKPHTFTNDEIKDFVPRKDTYRLKLPTCTSLPDSLPTTDKIFTLCHNKTTFMITMENAICSFWRFKNSKLEEFFEKTYDATQEQSIHNLHYAGQTIIDVMSHPHSHDEYYVLFEQKNNSLYNTYTAVKITWTSNKKTVEQLPKKLKVKQTEMPFAFLQRHENPFFDQKQDEICIGVFTDNFGRVTCTCAGDGETELRSIFCFCNQPLNQSQYENAFLNINCDDMLINEAIFSLPTSF